MKKVNRLFSLMLAIFLAVLCLPITVQADAITATEGWTAGSDGVFRISSPGDLLAFAANAEANAWYEDKTVVLTADIDMDGVVWVPPTLFKGVLDGRSFAIRNLLCKSGGKSGFIVAADGATIRNIRFENGTCTTAGGSYVGLIANATGEPSRFENMYVDFTVAVSMETGMACGGYVGQVEPGVSVEFTNCVSASTVSGLTAVGGFVGVNSITSAVTMTDCLFTGKLVTDNHAGGMIGRSAGSAILTRCVSLAQYEADNDTLATPSHYRTGLLHAYNQDTWGTVRPATAQVLTLVDCYTTIDPTLQSHAISSHVSNWGLRHYDVTVSYSDEETPTYRNNDILDNAAVADAVRTLAKGENVSFSAETFAEYDEFENWVLTGEKTAYSATGTIDVMMPASVAAMLGICPVANLQVQYAGEENPDGSIDLRWIAVVDDLRYANVGFRLQANRTANGETESSAEVVKTTTQVYTSIVADGETVTAGQLGGKYILAITVEGVDYRSYDHTFTVSALVTMQDGTVLTTAPGTFTVARSTATQ